ncbi:restriction endonuclease subunit S [Kribbella sp. NPDC051718]|uniref:restriction endonuclease subunit S n=1 Tax=Kribbella sp. NPDC051718 TaxID=3155168 RepID=UPI00343FC756
MHERALATVAVDRGLVGGPFGSDLVGADYVDDGVPVIRGANMLRRYVGGDFAFVTPDKFARDLARNNAVPGDLIFTQRGTLGQVAVVPRGQHAEYVVSQSQMRLRVDEEIADPTFVYYACSGQEFLNQINDNAISTGVPHTNLGILARLTIPDRPIQEQHAIAEVLGALDDKMSANDRIRALVDEVAMARFRRLSAGRRPARMADLAVINAGVTKPKPGASLRYIDISSVSQGDYVLPDESSWDDAPGRARRVVSAGDTVWSTVRPNRRSHALVLDDDPLLIASTGLAVLSPRAGRIAGVYEATRTEQFASYLESVAEGSAYPAVRAERFAEAPIPELDAADWDHFEEFALPLRYRAHAAGVESRRLAATRDALLPLLMSGKIRVRDAEKLVEEVV